VEVEPREAMDGQRAEESAAEGGRGCRRAVGAATRSSKLKAMREEGKQGKAQSEETTKGKPSPLSLALPETQEEAQHRTSTATRVREKGRGSGRTDPLFSRLFSFTAFHSLPLPVTLRKDTETILTPSPSFYILHPSNSQPHTLTRSLFLPRLTNLIFLTATSRPSSSTS
jgi:hypothetical protein